MAMVEFKEVRQGLIWLALGREGDQWDKILAQGTKCFSVATEKDQDRECFGTRIRSATQLKLSG